MEPSRTGSSPSVPLPRRGAFLLGILPFFRFFVTRKLLGTSGPLLGSFKITYRCNLRCEGCPFHRRGNEPGGHMDRETALRSLDRLREMGTLIVVFEGGEPLLWRDGSFTFNDLVLYARQRFPRVAVTTNGTFPLDVPVHVLWISLDGLGDVQDALRSGSFERIRRNLDRANHDKILVHMTLNSRNWREAAPLAEWVKGNGKIRGMTVQLFYPYGQGEAPLALAPRERRLALESVIELKRKGYPILNSAGRLRAMIDNAWTCHDDLLVNVDPDGTITRGCYVKGRGTVDCRNCGFTPVAEACGASDLEGGSLLAGWRLFVGP